jgi:hypothetical protein
MRKQCKLHPKYKGVRKPRAKRDLKLLGKCDCWSIYFNKHPNEKFPDFISGVPRSLNDWRRMGKESAERLMKMMKDNSGGKLF